MVPDRVELLDDLPKTATAKIDRAGLARRAADHRRRLNAVSTTDMTTKDHVRQFVLDELEYVGEPDDLTDEFELLEEGVLDSLGIMALVEYLEGAFDIVIDEDDIVAERFETIASIAALADTKLAG